MTRRLLKWFAWILATLLALPMVAIAGVLVLANLDIGRHLIEKETRSLTGGMVTLQGLGGRFPDALRVGQIQVSDAKGPYVTVSDVILDWSPLKLFEGVAQIDRLQAARVDLARLPESQSKTKSGSSFSLPVRVDLRSLKVDQAVIGAPVAGVPATLALTGSADLTTLTQGTVTLDARRLDSPGTYAVHGTVTPHDIQAAITAEEPAKGLIARIAHVPDVGPLAVRASANGPRDDLGTHLDLSAGPLKASVAGTVDLDHETGHLAVKAQAPAMTPGPGISWQSILVDATVSGALTKPDANGTVRIDDLTAAGARIGSIAADVKGNTGQLNLHAVVQDLHIPGSKPDVLAAAPVTLDAAANLDAADRPFTFALHHPLISVDGNGQAGGTQKVAAHLVLPDLGPLAAIGGANIQGSTDLNLTAEVDGDTRTATVKGRVAITGGMAPVPALIGDDGRVDLAASMHGQDITLSHLTINGKALDVTADGGMSGQTVNLNTTIGLSNLTAVQPGLSGKVAVTAHASGALDALKAQADIDADIAAKGYEPGHVTAHVDASGLPHAPHAVVNANGTLLGAPLVLALTADETDGVIKADISKADWKSLQAEGAVSLAQSAVLPKGKLQVTLGHLADLEPLIGKAIAGEAKATLDSDDQAARLTLTVRNAALPGTAAISKAVLQATVTDPTGHPTIDGSLVADGVSAGSAHSISARMTAKGPLDAVGLTVSADAPDIAGGPARLATAGTLDATNRTLALARLEASWKQQVLRLLSPAKFSFANGIAMDRVRLGFRQAELAVSGRVGSKLDLTATLRNLPADVAAIVDPSLAADGVIAADARLTGTSARPEGTIRVTANGVHLRKGPGQALPAANLAANVTLLGTAARLDTRLTAGPSHVTLTGTAPLSKEGSLDLKTDARIDLAMLDPLLLAEGRRARGEVTLNAAVTGTVAAPRVNGVADLRRGEVIDYALGVRVHDIVATVQASGDTIRLTRLSGKAGPGTLGGDGTIGLAGAMPVNLHFFANDARPISSELLTALIDLNLTVQGEVKGDLQASGTLHVRRADIRIPDKLPPGIAVLPVRSANAPPPPPPPQTPQTVIALNLTLDAPEQVFIRGRGLDAEVGGKIHIGGTTAKPVPEGGLHLRHGTLSIIGTTLKFTEGTIDFSGGSFTNPSLHFVATSTTTAIVATLTVSGTARDPQITLSSVPELPQDEILAQLLFNTSTSKLSPLQLAQIAAALASLSGATSGFDPLDKLRTTFGLDRLSVGSDAAGNPTVEAGRYIARGVYVGAKQSASGTGSQATVQVDLTKGLKLEATAGSASLQSATGSSNSGDEASVGLTYQFEY